MIRDMARETIERLESLSRDVVVNRGHIETLQAALGPEVTPLESTRQVSKGFDDVRLTMRALLPADRGKKYSAKLLRRIENLQDSIVSALKNRDIKAGDSDILDARDTTHPKKSHEPL